MDVEGISIWSQILLQRFSKKVANSVIRHFSSINFFPVIKESQSIFIFSRWTNTPNIPEIFIYLLEEVNNPIQLSVFHRMDILSP